MVLLVNLTLQNMSSLMMPFLIRFRPVQTILNGLPGDWQAQIVAGISLEFGIIQISNVDGMEFNIGPGVKYLYAMFHIEDVWDHSGVKNPTIAMPMLINSYVDLTARPICAQVRGYQTIRNLSQLWKLSGLPRKSV